MWLFSSIGFYSINRTPDNSLLQFRARREADLENLKVKFPQYFVGRDIMELPAADYRWRLETTDVYAGAIMAQMTTSISYRNFKKHLEGTDQADKLGILHDLWSMMYGYQNEQRLAGAWMEPEKITPHPRNHRQPKPEELRELFPDYLAKAGTPDGFLRSTVMESNPSPAADKFDTSEKYDDPLDEVEADVKYLGESEEEDLAAAADEGWPDDEDE